VTAVVRGNCVVITDTEERKEGVIDSGLLTVDADKTTVLTSSLTWNE
jgi:F-type H+-transporting ATPase subunit epsilon